MQTDKITLMLEESAKRAVDLTVERFRVRYKRLLLEGNGLKVVDIRLPSEMTFQQMHSSLCEKIQDIWGNDTELGMHAMGGAYDVLSLTACRQSLEEIISEGGK